MEKRELGKTGEKVPVIGLGTWGIGGFSYRDSSRDKEAIEVLKKGIELGMSFIDTAEMYAQGHSEEVVAKAIKDFKRDKVFIATKVSPENLDYDSVIKSAKASLQRLETNYIDLYQVHWPNPRIPIKETMRAMEYLVDKGLIRYIGVSNFSAKQVEECKVSLSKYDLVSNQVKYSLIDRSIEKDLLPYCNKEGLTIIAYSPLERGRLVEGEYNKKFEPFTKKYNKKMVQIALNWLIHKPQIIIIPKTIKINHLLEIYGSQGWRMSEEDYSLLERAF